MERHFAGGNLSQLVAGFHDDAMQHSIETSTRAARRSAVTAWKRYCELMNLDWLCKDYLVRELSQIITSFISFEIGVRGMNPNSIKKVYIGAINSYFGSQLIENYFDMASKSFFVKYIMRGFLKIHHLSHPKGEAKKLAFTVELIQYVDAAVVGKKVKGKDNAIFMRAIKLAMKFGIYFLMRKSEFMPGRSSGSKVDRKGLPFKWLQFAS